MSAVCVVSASCYQPTCGEDGGARVVTLLPSAPLALLACIRQKGLNVCFLYMSLDVVRLEYSVLRVVSVSSECNVTYRVVSVSSECKVQRS